MRTSKSIMIIGFFSAVAVVAVRIFFDAFLLRAGVLTSSMIGLTTIRETARACKQKCERSYLKMILVWIASPSRLPRMMILGSLTFGQIDHCLDTNSFSFTAFYWMMHRFTLLRQSLIKTKAHLSTILRRRTLRPSLSPMNGTT